MPHLSDGWFSFGLDCGDKCYLAVWRIDGEADTFAVPLEDFTIGAAECIYPARLETQVFYTGNVLTVGLKKRTARLFALRK
jgi:alpha-galactosidase